MAEVQGRRPEETSSPQSQTQGAEKWVLVAVLLLAMAIVAGVLAFSFRV